MSPSDTPATIKRFLVHCLLLLLLLLLLFLLYSSNPAREHLKRLQCAKVADDRAYMHLRTDCVCDLVYAQMLCIHDIPLFV